MFGIQKHKILIWSVIFSSFFFSSCVEKEQKDPNSGIEFWGETQGTTYHIILAEKKTDLTKEVIDSVLHQFDLSLSTYINESTVSALNVSKADCTVVDAPGFFKSCYELSKKVYLNTKGAFDPTVFPLVKGWGFMNNIETPLSKTVVDSILDCVGFENKYSIFFDGDTISIKKRHNGVKLDFNAIAQGYSVDVIADLMKSYGHENYYVEIGGELKVSGLNRSGEKWGIGLDVPKSDVEGRPIENVFYLSDKAIATSGNYRKFYEVNGVKYAHTLNPKTGFPVQHSLLSATVIADNCALADAYATAFMVMGTEKTMKFVEDNPQLNLAVYLLSATPNGEFERKMSDNFHVYLENK